MKTDENESRIALQPETQVEQSLLSEMFTRLSNIAEAPNHPEKVGSTLCWYTLDVLDYDLDHELFEEAECGVNEHGKLDPEPGSRALVIVHTPEAAGGEATQAEIDEAVEAIAEDQRGKEVEEPPFDPADKTVSDLEDEVDDEWDAATLRGLYEAEVNGEARKTALEHITECLEAQQTIEEVEA